MKFHLAQKKNDHQTIGRAEVFKTMRPECHSIISEYVDVSDVYVHNQLLNLEIVF